MREILFRGKSEDTNKWVYGSLVCITTDYVCINTGIGGLSPIIPNSAGQYTGLKDNNGNKIFEGDVLHCEDKNSGCIFDAVVMFGNPNGKYNWGWQLVPFDNSPAVNTDILCWIEMEETGATCYLHGNLWDKTQRISAQKG